MKNGPVMAEDIKGGQTTGHACLQETLSDPMPLF